MYFSKKKERQLIKMYPNTEDKDIARILGVSEWMVRRKAEELELEKESGDEWGKRDVDILLNLYTSHSNQFIADVLLKSKADVEHQAFRLGLQKEEGYFGNIVNTEQEKQLVKKWSEEYEHGKDGASNGAYVLGKILHLLYPSYNIKDEEPIGGLRLDWYIKELRLGFEFQGKQHREFNNFHYETKHDFYKAQQRDYDKSYMCEKSGISIVYLYDTEKLSIGLVRAKIGEVL